MSSIKPHTILVFLIATLLTVISYTLIDKYQNYGQQLLSNTLFSEDLKGWLRGENEFEAIADNGTITLQNQDKGKQIEIFQKVMVQANEDRFRFSADLRFANEVAGEKKRNRAGLFFVQYKDGKPGNIAPGEVSFLTGSQAWTTYSKLSDRATNCREFKVGIQLSQGSGKLFVRNPMVFRVKDNPLYIFTKWLAMFLWLVFYLCLFQPYWQSTTTKLFKLILALTVVTLIVSIILPGQIKNNLYGNLLRKTNSYIAPIEQMAVKMHVVDASSPKMVLIGTMAHFLFFSFLVCLLILGIPESSLPLVFLYLVLIACSTELIQFFIKGRSPHVHDFIIDIAGGGLVLLGWHLIRSCKGMDRTKV